MNIFSRFMEKKLKEESAPPSTLPDSERQGLLGLRRMDNFSPPWRETQRDRMSVADARDTIGREMMNYARDPSPDHALLVVAAAGTGKSWKAVEFAHELADSLLGQRVFFAGQRHDALPDLLTAAVVQGKDPNMWLEWLPRQGGQEDPAKNTCMYPGQISAWMQKGYAGREFCEAICQWNYINNECKYHAQKNREEKIIFGQHAHVVLGHPLMSRCAILIGDENPMGVFPKTWIIPSKFLYTPGMDWQDPLTEMFFKMRDLSEKSEKPLRGPALIEALGSAVRSEIDAGKSNAQVIYELCDSFALTPDAIMAPRISQAGDVAGVDYNFLPYVVPMLKREADYAQRGDPYIDRLTLSRGSLAVTMRNYVNDQVPRHVIWFDATGERDFYESLFRREVKVVDAVPAFMGKIYQVHDRLNGKGSLIKDGDALPDPEFERVVENDKPVVTEAEEIAEVTRQVEQAKVIFELLARKHKRMSVISFKALTGHLAESYEFMHFYANRGSNKLEGTDGLIVFGTPMPSIPAMIEQAKAIFFERMEPFDTRWVTEERAYRVQDEKGNWLGNTVRIFMDPQLNVILWQSREAEIIQSVNRGRPVINGDVVIYLFSNIPIDSVPPDRLVSMAELLGFEPPAGTDPLTWARIKMAADDLYDETGSVTGDELAARAGVSESKAFEAMNYLLDEGEWDMAIVRGGTGRKRRSLVKRDE